jgi:hypothetical protein
LKKVITAGFKKAWSTFFELTRILVPVYVFVTFLRHTGFIKIAAGIFSPVMKLIGLPGEAMLALLTAFLLNIYGGIGVILSLELGPREITILGTMMGIAHSLIVETAIFKKIGVDVLKINFLRIFMSFLVGFILNMII